MKVYAVTTTSDRGGHDSDKYFMVDKVFYTEAAAHEYRRKRDQWLRKYGEEYRFRYDIEVVETEIE